VRGSGKRRCASAGKHSETAIADQAFGHTIRGDRVFNSAASEHCGVGPFAQTQIMKAIGCSVNVAFWDESSSIALNLAGRLAYHAVMRQP
jgi:hypothetical protein